MKSQQGGIDCANYVKKKKYGMFSNFLQWPTFKSHVCSLCPQNLQI